MLNTLDLLRLSPKEALTAIIQERMNTGLEAKYFNVSPPVSLGGTLTKVNLSINKSEAPTLYWPYLDDYAFEYNRLDLANELGDLNLKLVTVLPTTKHEAIRKLFAKSDLFFDGAELFDGDINITDSSFVVAAKPTSSRWVGQVTIQLERKVDDLANFAPITVMGDLLEYDTADLKHPGSAELRLIHEFVTVNSLDIAQPFDVNDFEFTNVTKLSNRDDQPNTQVTLRMVNESRYKGSVVLSYRRLLLQKVSDYQNVLVYNRNPMSKVDLAVLAADQLNIELVAGDIIEGPIPYLMDGGFVDVSIFADLSSLMYVGELTVEWHKSNGAPV